MLNNWVNFKFSIMKKIWDLAQENLINIQGSYGILDQYVAIRKKAKLLPKSAKFYIRKPLKFSYTGYVLRS